jgi:hypothetical protein
MGQQSINKSLKLYRLATNSTQHVVMSSKRNVRYEKTEANKLEAPDDQSVGDIRSISGVLPDDR